jgi:low temperature requirement protein LtrA
LIIVAGVVCISAGAGTIAAHPAAPVPLIKALIILAGPTLFLLGTCLFDWSVTSRLSWVRMLAALLALALTPAVYQRPTWIIMLAVDVVLLLTLIAEELTKKVISSRPRSA